MLVKKIILGFINVFFVCIVSIFLILSIFLFIGIKPYIVMSGSMEPEIQTGSLVFVDQKQNFDDVKVGDVIAFKMNDTLVTHRAICLQNGMVETKGDNNDISDGFTTNKDNFVGVSKFWIPKAGYLFAWIQTKQGMILSITFALCFIILDLGLSNSDKKEKKAGNEK